MSPGTRFGEVVFNTSMTGYQEVLTDPSYRGQIVVMTQPHIGNYGTSPEVAESERPWVEGFIARQFTVRPSGVAPDEGLVAYLRRHGVPALQGHRHPRAGAAAARARRPARRAHHRALGRRRPGRRAGRLPHHGRPGAGGRGDLRRALRDARRWGEERRHLAVYDFGVKTNILRSLAERGARLTVLPARTPAERGPGAAASTAWCSRTARATRSRCTGDRRERPRADRGRGAGLRHLPRPPAPRPRPRRQRPSSSSSATTAATSRSATSPPARWRSPARTTASPSIPTSLPAGCARHPGQPERRHRRGLRRRRQAGLLRPVPPRSRPRPPRRRVPLRPLPRRATTR